MSELRQDPLTGRWVIVAEGRSARPNEYAGPDGGSSAADDCPFCEGHESRTPPEVAALRPTGGPPNGPGWTVRAIPNRFPTLSPSEGPAGSTESGTFVSAPGDGWHEVVVLSPDHSVPLASLPPEGQGARFRFLRDRVRAAGVRPSVAATLLFENKGPESGGTLPHPHAQLVASGKIPRRLAEEAEAFRRSSGTDSTGCALERIVRAETQDGGRLVSEDDRFTVLAPFAAEHAYEVWVVPRRHSEAFDLATDEEIDTLSSLLPRLLRALDRIRPGVSYNWIVHGLRPTGDRDGPFHWHLEVVPRTVRPDGFEVGGGIPVNPVAPERAAAEYRARLAE
jgi:UDPglucose--hexose-1-phosphate uridylyltransferase